MRVMISLGLSVAMLLMLSAGSVAQEQEKEREKVGKEKQKKAEATSILRHDDIMDQTVRDQEGQEVGQVQDVLIGLPDGQIRYVAFSSDELVEGENQWAALPWAAFQVTHQPQQQEGQQQPTGKQEGKIAIELQISPQLVRQAPTFEENSNWPASVDQTYLAQLEEEVGKERIELGFRGPAEGREGEAEHTGRLSGLPGLSVWTSTAEDAEEVGDIEHFMFDARQGKVAFVTVGAGGFLELGENVYAVPLETLGAHPAAEEGEDPYFTLKISPQQLEQAPQVQDDADYAMVHQEVEQFRTQSLKERDAEKKEEKEERRQ